MGVMNKPQRIRVLVVEDSPVVQAVLVKLLKDDPQFEVIGTANNGQEAVAFVARTKPDVVLMDVHMPKMDGIEATRQIMEQHPVPIVVASATIQSHEVPLAFRAMQAGALAFVDKSAQVGSPQFSAKPSAEADAPPDVGDQGGAAAKSRAAGGLVKRSTRRAAGTR